MKVWVVVKVSWPNRTPVRAFSSFKKAKEFIKSLPCPFPYWTNQDYYEVAKKGLEVE